MPSHPTPQNFLRPGQGLSHFKGHGRTRPQVHAPSHQRGQRRPELLLRGGCPALGTWAAGMAASISDQEPGPVSRQVRGKGGGAGRGGSCAYNDHGPGRLSFQGWSRGPSASEPWAGAPGRGGQGSRGCQAPIRLEGLGGGTGLNTAEEETAGRG